MYLPEFDETDGYFALYNKVFTTIIAKVLAKVTLKDEKEIYDIAKDVITSEFEYSLGEDLTYVPVSLKFIDRGVN